MTARVSLRQFLNTYSLVFVVLNLGSLAFSALLLWSWGEASRDALRLTEMIAILKEVRGTAYRQVKEAFDSRFLGDAEARDQYREFAERIERRLLDLESLSASEPERIACVAVRQAYDGIARRMASSFAPGESGDNPQDLDTPLEQRDFRAFEAALGESEASLALARTRRHRRAHRLLALLPWLLAMPLIMSVGTLFWSRRYLAKNVVEPLQSLERSIRTLPTADSTSVTTGQAALEIEHVSETFARMSAELEHSRKALVRAEREAALASLVPVLAHNIRNPLASIRAAAQLSEGAVEDRCVQESLGAIVRTVDRIDEWTRAMLSYLGPMQPQSKPCDLRRLCDTAAELLRARIEQRGVRIEREGWEQPRQVRVDEVLMEQALHGLLANALDASPSHGVLRLRVDTQSDEHSLAIEDAGPGISFQPPAAGAAAGPTTKQFGTGLGIPFAQRVCELHGAALDFERVRPRGTRVTIRFRSRAQP